MTPEAQAKLDKLLEALYLESVTHSTAAWRSPTLNNRRWDHCTAGQRQQREKFYDEKIVWAKSTIQTENS